MLMLPKNDREERAISRFLDYYNQTNATSYEIRCWLDREPRSKHDPQESIPDCLCVDATNGNEMIIEYTMLTGDHDLRLAEGAEKFLADVRTAVKCQLPGVFLLYDWRVNALRFTSNNRGEKIAELCREILAVAPGLAEGQEVLLSQPFPVKLRKEEASKVKADSALIWTPLEANSNSRNPIDQQLLNVLDEGNRKFVRYDYKATILLINIWETGLDYEGLKRIFPREVTLKEYPNIKHIYLSEGLPNPLIYHLYAHEREFQ